MNGVHDAGARHLLRIDRSRVIFTYLMCKENREDGKACVHSFDINLTSVFLPSIGGCNNFGCKQPEYFCVIVISYDSFYSYFQLFIIATISHYSFSLYF